MNLKLVVNRLNPLLLAFALLSPAAIPASALTAAAGARIPTGTRAASAGPSQMLDLTPRTASPAVPPDENVMGLGATATPITVTSYAWTKTWGGTGDVQAANVAVDKLGNLFVAGEYDGRVNFDPAQLSPHSTFTSTNGTVDAYLTKFNSSGQFQWVRTWGGAPKGTPANGADGRDAANGVAVDDLGNAYVAGLFQYTVDFGAGFVYTSNVTTTGIVKNNIFFAKFGPDGTTQWAKAWGGKTGGEGYSVAVDAANGAAYVEGDWSTNPNTGMVDFNPGGAGGVRQNHGFYDAFLSKYDLNGNFQWVRTWGGSQYDDGPGVAVDASGNVYVCGMYGSQDIDFDPALTDPTGLGHPASDDSSQLLDIFLTKFDANGNWKWVRTWGGPGVEDAGTNVVIDQAGDVYAGGRFKCTNCNFDVGAGGPGGPGDVHSTHGDFDAFLSKFKPDGTFVWAQTWGGTLADQLGALAVDDANNVSAGGVMQGVINPATYVWTSATAFFRKFTPDGTFQWEKSWGTNSQPEWLLDLATDNAHHIYASGSFRGTVDFNPSGMPDAHTSASGKGAYLSMHTTIVLTPTLYLPLVTR